MTADALALLFRRLVLAAQEAGALARPIEVSEILDRFVPYRSARRDGLLDTNDDYLHAVMQLLAGERGYLFADDLMQDDLKSELTALNPDLSVLTTYRNAKVRIASTQAEQVLAGDTSIDLRPPTPIATERVPPPARASDPVLPPARASSPVARPSAPSAGTTTTPTAPRGVSRASAEAAEQPVPPVLAEVTAVVPPPAPVAAKSAPLADESVAAVCPYCSKDIATDRPLKYCPHCGINLRIRRCPGCSAEMEAEWKFCVTCGRSAP